MSNKTKLLIAIIFFIISTLTAIELAYSQTEIYGPYIQYANKSNVEINLISSKRRTTTLFYGTNYENSKTVSWPGDVYDRYIYKFVIPNSTENQYRIVHDDSVREGSFRKVQSGSSFQFAILGDTQSGTVHSTLSNHILSRDPLFLIHLGDHANDVNFTEWKNCFFNPGKNYLNNIPIFSVIGNHDRNSFNDYYRKIIDYEGEVINSNGKDTPDRVYSFMVGNCIFCILDPSLGLNNYSPQYQWLEIQLSQASYGRAFVFSHEPSISSTDPNKAMNNDNFDDLLGYYGATLFSGHVHCFEENQKYGIKHIISGGGTSPSSGVIIDDTYNITAMSLSHFLMVNVSGESVSCQVVNENNQVVYTFDLSSEPVPEPILRFYPEAVFSNYLQPEFNFKIFNDGDASMEWELNNPNWIDCTPNYGILNQNDSVLVTGSVNYTLFPCGNGTGTISIQTEVGTGEILIYAGDIECPPAIDVSPSSLQFYDETEDEFYIINAGGGTLNFNVSCSNENITLSQYSGAVTNQLLITVTVNLDNFEPGYYAIPIYITSDGGNETILCQINKSFPQTETVLFAVNCGNLEGNEYTDSEGIVWSVDREFRVAWLDPFGYVGDDGEVFNDVEIAGTNDDYIYQFHKYPAQTYFFQLSEQENTEYSVNLKFSENAYNTPDGRCFDVFINGTKVINDLNVFSEVGFRTALDKTFSVISNQSTDLTITFVRFWGSSPFINGIKITKSVSLEKKSINDMKSKTDFQLYGYPNPFQDKINTKPGVMIYNIIGQKIGESNQYGVISAINYPAGIYFIRDIKVGNTIKVIKLK